MQVHFGLGTVRAEWSRAVVCIGTFDGVHLGHQAVISCARETAERDELPLVLVTFDRNPAAVLTPDRRPLAINGLAANLRHFEALGVAVVVVLAFSPDLSRMTAEHFLDEILLDGLRASCVVVGHDFALGQGREGDIIWLSERIETVAVPPFELDGLRVSSTAVRISLAEGRLEEANLLLGRPFCIEGVVVGGQRLGRQLGYPTANIARSSELVLPPYGVYATRVRTRSGTYFGAASIGLRPTVDGKGRTIEVYLLDYPGHSLYGPPVAMDVYHRLRPELKFTDLEALKAQMALDVLETRSLLA
jgi:riboflavin kinase/FMN adenylyltransferase